MMGLQGSLPSMGNIRAGLGASAMSDPINNPRWMSGTFGGGGDVMDSFGFQNRELQGMANDPSAGSMQRWAGPRSGSMGFNYGAG